MYGWGADMGTLAGGASLDSSQFPRAHPADGLNEGDEVCLSIKWGCNMLIRQPIVYVSGAEG